MGWNDHVEFVEMQCEECGEVSTWEVWDATARSRYSGELGRRLGLDVSNDNRCPHCGSHVGVVEEDS